MSGPIETFVTRYLFQADSHEVSEFSEQLERVNKRLEFLGAIEVGKIVFELAERFGQFADKLSAAAFAAGTNVEMLQKLHFAAAQTGVSAEEVNGGLARLTRSLYEAQNGSKEAAEQFRKAGFSREEVLGLHSGSAAFLALSDHMKGIQDPAKRTALMMQLVGRGSANMAELMSQGSAGILKAGEELQRYGGVISKGQVETLKEAADSLDMLWQVVKAFTATVASYLAPSVKELVHSTLEWWAANHKVIEMNIARWAWGFMYILGYVSAALEDAASVVVAFVDRHKDLVRNLVLGTVAFTALNWILGLGKGALKLFAQGLDLIITPAKAVAMAVWEFGAKLLEMEVAGDLFSAGTVPKMLASLKAMGNAFLATTVKAFGILGMLTVFAAAVAGVVAAVSTLWQMLAGRKFEDTWLGQMLGPYAKKVGDISKWLGLSGDTDTYTVVDGKAVPVKDAKQKQAILDDDKAFKAQQAGMGVGPTGALDNLGGNMADLQTMAAQDPSGRLSAAATGQQPQVNNTSQNITVNAPLTVNGAPAGTDPKAFERIARDAIKEQLGTAFRQSLAVVRSGQSF